VVKRRAHGEGTIYKRTDGLWVAQITLPDGKRKSKYSRNQKEVKDWLLAQRNALQQGLWVKDETLTVGAFFDRFLTDSLKFKLKENSYEGYSDIVRLHIKPTIGNIKLTDLRPYHLQDLYKLKKEAGLSNRTVQYIHAVIHRGLEQAYKWGLVVRNVSDLAEAPRPEKRQPTIFTVEQCKIFLDGLKGDRLYPLYAMAIGCGLRLGELLALEWEDINFQHHTVSVNKTLHHVRGKNYLGEPKSEAARRLVSVPDFVMESLQPQLQGLVFATGNGTHFSHRNIGRHFNKTIERLGLPKIRFHDLRHTYASLMLMMNVHPKTVQEALGHSSVSLTLNTYSHIIPSMQKDAADKMNDLMRM